MDNEFEIPPSPYWMLQFIVKQGDWIAIACGLLPLVASVALVALYGLPSLVLVAGVVGSLFLFLLMRSFVELVRVIVDMLLPK
jgi:hypothetical protein